MGPFQIIFLVFGIIALGYLASRFRLLAPGTGDGLADFVFVVAIPLLLFKTISSMDLGQATPWRLWACYFSGIFIVWIAAYVLIRGPFGRDRRVGVLAGLSGSFSNIALLGIPFVLGVYGHRGLDVLSLVLSVHLPLMFSLTVLFFEWAGRRDGTLSPKAGLKHSLQTIGRNLIGNPIVIGILAGLAWRATSLSLPPLVDRLVGELTSVAGPVALFAMGMSLTKFGISGNVKPALTLAVCKVVVMPAAVLAMAFLFHLPPFTAKIALALASLPGGINPYLIANRLGTAEGLASNAMVISTALAVVSMGLWLAVAQAVFA